PAYINIKRERERGLSVVATTRRLPSDSGAFADWSAPSSSARVAAPVDDLSLGFNAGPPTTAGPTAAAPQGMWPSRSLNYGLAPPDMPPGMVGLRDVFVVAPASSFHHHHHHHNDAVLSSSDLHHLSNNSSNNPATALGVGVGVGVIPLLTATPCLDQDNILTGRARTAASGGTTGGGIQFWQEQQPHHHQYLKKQGFIDHNIGANLVPGGGSGSGSGDGGASNSGGGTTTCQDCGNQAKKDCAHRRCRTCCKSRGFDCPTHVKSTWVPAARRRERQLITGTTPSTAAAVAGSSGSTSGAKKPRLISSQTTTNSHTSTSNTTPPRSFDTYSSHQDASFKEKLPGQIRAPAVFKCVRVTSVDDEQDEYAYQAVVKIGGRVFKGFLYDQGHQNHSNRDSNNSNNNVYPNLSELHLGGGGGGGSGGGGRNGVSSSSPMLDPSDVYAASGGGGGGGVGGLLGGSTYGNPIN
ncbi:protein LATERAL ROOT PRIMORDIUM 1, partial [Arachis ipaensis]